MSYVRLNLSDGQVFNASHVSHIEDGIEDCETQLSEVNQSLSDISSSGSGRLYYKRSNNPAASNNYQFKISLESTVQIGLLMTRYSAYIIYRSSSTYGAVTLLESSAQTVSVDSDGVTLTMDNSDVFAFVLSTCEATIK